MKIVVKFLNGTAALQAMILENAARVSDTLSHPDFIKKVRAWQAFDFTNHSAVEVADVIETAGTVEIRVGFYKGWFFSRAIAYEEFNTIYFNTRKLSYGAGGMENVAHETMHVLGFAHRGNSPAGNENTVPWRIGQWVGEWNDPMSLVSNGEHAREVAGWEAEIRAKAEIVS